jgi:hypothetical protein
MKALAVSAQGACVGRSVPNRVLAASGFLP